MVKTEVSGMFSLDPIIEKIFAKIEDAKLAPIQREQLAMLHDYVAFLGEKLAAGEKALAKAENALEARNAELEDLRSRLAAFDGRAKLVEIGPCFVKETVDGRKLEGVYCPDCKMPMDRGEYGADGEIYYHCMKCSVRLPVGMVDPALDAWKHEKASGR